MKRKFIFIMPLLFMSLILFAEKTGQFPSILLPHHILVEGDELFILEQYRVKIYSLKTFKMKIVFGKKGEGPGEFKSRVTVSVNPEYILANSRGKFSYFDRKGKLLKEIKNNHIVSLISLTESKIIGRALQLGNQKETFSNFLIFNSTGEVIKKICHRKIPQFRSEGSPTMVLDNYFPEVNIVFKTTRNKIFISGKSGFTIEVYNEEGFLLKTISRGYEPKKVSGSDRKEMLKFYENPYIKRNWHQLKNLVKIPDYYPYYNTFLISDNQLWVQTFKRRGNKTEFLLFNLEGNFLGESYLPLRYKDRFTPFLYDINDGILFQLVLNEDTDIYELHQVKINNFSK